MGYTSFGEYVRILRIKNHEVMGDMAGYLGVSVAFLSAVENGRKNVPEDWSEKLAQKYGLNEEEISEMENSIANSKTQMKLNLAGTSNKKREMALQIARSFDEMDDETAEKILEVLNGDGL